MAEYNPCFGSNQHRMAFECSRTIHARTILVGTHGTRIGFPAQSDLTRYLSVICKSLIGLASPLEFARSTRAPRFRAPHRFVQC